MREKTGSEFPSKSPWWAWALRHAAWIYNRFHVRADTRVTPYSKIRLKTYAQPVLPFGDLFLARRPGAHFQKSQTQFVYGCWLGRDSHTDEHIVGSKAGVFRTRTVRRLTEDRSWSAEAVADRNGRRGRPRQRPEAGHQRLLLERGMNPSGTHHCQRCPTPTVNRHPRSVDSKARSETVRDATSTSGKSDVQERPPLEPDGERAAKTPRRDVEDTSMPDPGGAPSSSSAAASSTPLDPGETTPARPTRPRSPDPPIGESLATPLPKRLRSASVDDSGMVAALAEVTEMCEEPQPDWEALASSDNVGSTWFIRRYGARMVHLAHLRE